MIDDPLKGFIVKNIGSLISERVVGFNWAGCGDIFNTFEEESTNKYCLAFYLICKE